MIEVDAENVTHIYLGGGDVLVAGGVTDEGKTTAIVFSDQHGPHALGELREGFAGRPIGEMKPRVMIHFGNVASSVVLLERLSEVMVSLSGMPEKVAS